MSIPRFWAVIPAAGIGSRMGANVPKQYLPLNGKIVIEHSLAALLEHRLVKGVVVALAEDDPFFANLDIAQHPKLTTVFGGETRADSVLAGLVALSARADADDWVLVHDAARPCLNAADIDALINALQPGECGAILAQPVVETVKMCDAQLCVDSTIDRRRVYLAQTPQCFRLQPLRDGYATALVEHWNVTDEASVFERLGHAPRLVAGGRHNLKITHPEDLALASFYLQQEI